MDADLYSQICSYDNLYTAYKNARKGKTLKQYVIDFEANLVDNLHDLQIELRFHIYKPKPLQTFILRDPKTRCINKSAFRDRIVHHALCNIIAPLIEKQFIFDSFANRKGKGTFKAIERFETFSRIVSKNHTKRKFVLKADIKKYFEHVNHTILLDILKRTIKDKRVLWLIKRILYHYSTSGRGMPLGNLTSQFFANVYLNELDQFVKHTLKAKYYLRYVDDFVIIHNSAKTLEKYMDEVNCFLREKLALTLHPQKSSIAPLDNGVQFLGMRIFPYYQLLKQKNLHKFRRKIESVYEEFSRGLVEYDPVYDLVEGWCAYAKNANTHNLRKTILDDFEKRFTKNISTKEVNRLTRPMRKKR
jgi:RNA-directed DNA polymerase